jgi:exodeoxyribonuclease VII large subunit
MVLVASLRAVSTPLPLFSEPADSAVRRVTLVRLAGEIARCLVTIGRVSVEGEVHRPTTSRGGWIFFTLRDRVAQIEVRVPGPAARRSRVQAGERVSVVGSLQWSNERGQLQLVAEEIVPVGAGAIAALIAETRARLAAEGILGRAARRLPVLPAAVGVVCGTEAAVRKDIESVAAARCPGYPMVFAETTVTGPGAPVSIVAAIESLARTPGVEVLILARGGGDAPSLLPWSDEAVCRAVAACPVPVVSAIGHEGDRPLCDEVADLRCGTPSLAATAVLPDLLALGRAVDDALGRAATALQSRVEHAGRRLEAVDVGGSVRSGLDRAGERLARARLQLSAHHPSRRLPLVEARLAAAVWRRPMWESLGRAAGRLDAEARHLRALSPHRTLERGYAIAVAADGSVLRRAADAKPGDEIGVRLAEGALSATVMSVETGPSVDTGMSVETGMSVDTGEQP